MESNWSGVEAARGQAQAAGKSALDYSTKGMTLADELRKAVGERFAESPIAKQSAEARAGFLSAAPQGRADILSTIQGGTILSPTQQQAILASKRASALAPVMGSNIIQKAAFGTMEDLISAGTNAWNAAATQQQGLAQLAQQSYSSLLNELVTRANQEAAAKQLGWQGEEAARASELFPLQKEQLAKNIAQIGVRAGREPDKYPFSEPWISAGLAGQPVSTIGNKVGADVQARLNKAQGKAGEADIGYKEAQTQKIMKELEPKPNLWNLFGLLK